MSKITIEISVEDSLYDKITKYCGGSVHPEDAIIIMVKSFIRNDEEQKDLAKRLKGDSN